MSDVELSAVERDSGDGRSVCCIDGLVIHGFVVGVAVQLSVKG